MSSVYRYVFILLTNLNSLLLQLPIYACILWISLKKRRLLAFIGVCPGSRLLKLVIPLKKHSNKIILLLCGLVAGIVLSCLVFIFIGFPAFGGARKQPSLPSEATNAELTATAYRILEYIKDGDYTALSKEAHPEYGVVFSPCATITLSTNRYFRPEQIAGFGDDSGVYVWGVRSSSGEPIEMTPADYFAKYVYDKDYTAASIIGVNYIVKSGNALENIMDVFQNVQFVDFHINGGDKDSADDLSWSSLRLGFEEYEGGLWLTVIAHSTWTE